MRSFPRSSIAAAAARAEEEDGERAAGTRPEATAPARRRSRRRAPIAPQLRGVPCAFRPPSRGRARSSGAGGARGSSKGRGRGRGRGGTSASPAGRRTEWDATTTDMSRYRLPAAEQTRRQALRVSKHREEAAAAIQEKLQRMQANLAPFLEEPEGARHMTPCFASRVPTGRLPEELEQRLRAQRERALAPEVPLADVQAHRVVHEDLEAEVDDPMMAALHGELRAYYAKQTPSVPKAAAPAPSPPKFSFLRKAPTDAEPKARAPTRSTTRVAVPRAGPPLSGGATPESEDLEAQLLWWRRQRDILGMDDAEAGPPWRSEDPQELIACSHWLRMEPDVSAGADVVAAEVVEVREPAPSGDCAAAEPQSSEGGTASELCVVDVALAPLPRSLDAASQDALAPLGCGSSLGSPARYGVAAPEHAEVALVAKTPTAAKPRRGIEDLDTTCSPARAGEELETTGGARAGEALQTTAGGGRSLSELVAEQAAQLIAAALGPAAEASGEGGRSSSAVAPIPQRALFRDSDAERPQAVADVAKTGAALATRQAAGAEQRLAARPAPPVTSEAPARAMADALALTRTWASELDAGRSKAPTPVHPFADLFNL